MSDAEQNTVTRNDEQSRYEIHVGDTLAGFVEFAPDTSRRVVLTHTEVDPAFKGRGLAATLVNESLGDLARRGETVVPRCPFVVSYLKENEIAGLVVDWPHQADAGDSASPGEQSG